MTRVTGVGCSATAMIGAFAAVQPDAWRATAAAMAYLGVVGEWAAERVQAAGGGVGRLPGGIARRPAPALGEARVRCARLTAGARR